MSSKKLPSTPKDAEEEPTPQGSSLRKKHLLIAAAVLAAFSGIAVLYCAGRNTRPSSEMDTLGTAEEFKDIPLKDFRVVNAHEHLMARKHFGKYLKAAQATGVVETLFVASSEYTIKGKEGDPRKGNDENSEEMLAAAREHPRQIVPFCTIHPGDPAKLDKLKQFVAKGAKGLKLYTGHSNFYDRPLDVEDMIPIYAFCAETQLPICWHVNIVKYGDEFERVMARFPNLIVIVPHFGVTFFSPRRAPFQRFQRLLDTYPGLYTDTSFGTRAILVQGLEAVSRDPEIFRDFFQKYQDRILFGTDMVVSGNKEKTAEWIEAVIQACRDCLEKNRYRFFMGAKGSPYADERSANIHGEFRGLALDDDILRKVYETNFRRLFPTQ